MPLPSYFCRVNEKFDFILDLLFPHKKPSKQQIKNLILKISDIFTHSEKERPYNYMSYEDFVQGYVLYFTPVNLSKLISIFNEMAMHPLFFNTDELKILDIGVGPTPSVVAIFDLIERGLIKVEHIRYVGIESQDNVIKISKKILENFILKNLDFKYEFIKADASDLDLYRELRAIKPNMLIFSNSLGEIIDRNSLKLENLPDILKPFIYKNPYLTIIIVEPGTKKSSTRIHRIRDIFIKELGFYPYSPCLNDLPCSALKANNWCYEERKWSPPTYLSFLSSMGLQINYLKFSYLVMRMDKINISDTFKSNDEIIKNTSNLLNEKGKSRLWACWRGELIDMEKLKRDFTKDEVWLKIRKGSYFSIDKYETISSRKVRILADSNIKVLYSP